MKRYGQLGLKLTPQRVAILEYLENNENHPSAHDIYRAVSRRFPNMSFATVYNTLRALKEREKVCELAIDPEKRRYDPNILPHHHLICIKCCKIADIKGKFDLDLPEMHRHGFEVLGSRIDFYGVCSQCREKQEKKERSQ